MRRSVNKTYYFLNLFHYEVPISINCNLILEEDSVLIFKLVLIFPTLKRITTEFFR